MTISLTRNPLAARRWNYPSQSSLSLLCVRAIDQDDSIRSGMTLVPFQQRLNRWTLKLVGASQPRYRVSWGTQSRVYSKEELSAGVNLAEDFPENPFSECFARVDQAVLAKQTYETKQIKQTFHSSERKRILRRCWNERRRSELLWWRPFRRPLSRSSILAMGSYTVGTGRNGVSNQIEFTDCEHCGKRIRTTASHCHRCGMKHVAASSKLSSARRGDEEGLRRSKTRPREKKAIQRTMPISTTKLSSKKNSETATTSAVPVEPNGGFG